MDKLYRAEYWQYRAEETPTWSCNIVKTTVLRLRKTERRTRGEEVTLDGRKDLSEESLFPSKVIGLLLGEEFVEQLIPISLPIEFLRDLAVAVEDDRPDNRLHKGIDYSQAVGFLALDHTQFIRPSATDSSVAVEIKPKWGFLQQSAFVPKDLSIKQRKCRFCMYQHSKLKTRQEDSLSKFCPIDLFSGDELLVQDALDDLVQTPQNNLQLFINGVQQQVTEEAMIQCIAGPNNSKCQSSQGTSQPASLTDVLAQILIQSPLLRRLSRLQQGLDSLDVHTIHRFYNQLADPSTGTLPQPTMDEFLDAAETFLYRTDMNEMMSKDIKTFTNHNIFSIGFVPEDDLDDPETIPPSLKLHFIREFLLSMTLKDCSILITVRRADHTDEIKQDEDKMLKGVDVGVFELKEDYHRIHVKDENFDYKITCIDLDPKNINSIPMQQKKDRDIVSHYLSVVGDREMSCGSR